MEFLGNRRDNSREFYTNEFPTHPHLYSVFPFNTYDVSFLSLKSKSMFFNKMATRRKLIWYSYLSATVPVTVGRLFQKHLYCKSYCTSCYVYIVW